MKDTRHRKDFKRITSEKRMNEGQKLEKFKF